MNALVEAQGSAERREGMCHTDDSLAWLAFVSHLLRGYLVLVPQFAWHVAVKY